MINSNVKDLVPSATLRINEYSNELARQGKEVFKWGFGQSPFPVPDVMIKALQERAHEKAYLPVKGLYELREVVAAYYRRTQNLDCQAENVLIAPGSKMYLYITQLAYDGELILPAPSWVSYAPQAQIIGKKAHWIPTTEANHWRLTAEDLDDFCKKNKGRKILLLNYPNNPTGITYPNHLLKELAEVARKHQLLILSDEIYGELHHEGKHVSIAQHYPEGTIITSGLSKWAGAGGWRMGTIVVPKELNRLRDAMATIASETFTTASAPIQYGSIPAFQNLPELENYRIAARKILKCIGTYTHQSFEALNISTPKPEGGFYSFINFKHYQNILTHKGIVTSSDLSHQLLKETGIALLPSIDFGKKSNELLFRMAYVDFDGKAALDTVCNNIDQDLSEHFVEKNAPKMKKGMERLSEWLHPSKV